MFTVELKLNGALIGHIYGRNVDVTESGACRYAYEYYEPEQRKIFKGTVEHVQADGIRRLVRAVLEDVDG